MHANKFSLNNGSSLLNNAKINTLTAEEIIKKYENVLKSREKQIAELLTETKKNKQNLESVKNTYDKTVESNNLLKTKLTRKEELLKIELNNKEIMFNQLNNSEKEYDELKKKIDEYTKNHKDKNENVGKNNEEQKEKNIKKDIKIEEKPEVNVKSTAKEKINQLKNKNDKKINFAELLKKSN